MSAPWTAQPDSPGPYDAGLPGRASRLCRLHDGNPAGVSVLGGGGLLRPSKDVAFAGWLWRKRSAFKNWRPVRVPQEPTS